MLRRWWSSLRAVGRVVASAFITLLGLLLVTFLIGRLLPVDPVLAVVGEQASAETYAKTRAELGLDKPLPEQLFIYAKDVASGNLGKSFFTGNPITQDLRAVFPATVELAVAAILIGVCLGVPLGIWAATRQNGWPDHVVRLVGILGHSIPSFWLGMLGLLVFYAKLGWVPGTGRVSDLFDGVVIPHTGFMILDALLEGRLDVAGDAAAHLILPASILGVFSVANISRMMRNFVLAELRQEYVTTARIKGLTGLSIIWRHVLPNTLVPLTTVIALAFGSLLEGAVLTETIFGWPGLGLYMKNSLLNADMNAVMGGTLLIGTVFIGLNLTTDLLARFFDPRATT